MFGFGALNNDLSKSLFEYFIEVFQAVFHCLFIIDIFIIDILDQTDLLLEFR